MVLDPSTQPVDVSLAGADALVIAWADRHASRFELVELRRSCTCAQCAELRATGMPVWPHTGAPRPLRLSGAELTGAWGLNLRWNDGHEAGIYSWETLRSWCSCPRCRADRADRGRPR